MLKNKGYKEGRVYFDVENYKNRREIALVEMAEKMANKAVKLQKPVRLDRMSAYERKIIHTDFGEELSWEYLNIVYMIF